MAVRSRPASFIPTLLGLIAVVGLPAHGTAQPPHRQATLTVLVQNPAGEPLEGATVTVEMTNHAFRFGTAVAAGRIEPGNPQFSPQTVEALQTYFNSLTYENELKWTEFEARGPERTRQFVDTAFTYSAFNGNEPLRQRGHATVWGSAAFVPNDVEALTDPAAIRTRILNHVAAYHETFAGRGLDAFDLYNEPFHESELLIDKIVPGGTSAAQAAEVAIWFQAAKAADPEAFLFINEYNLLNFWQENDSAIHQYKQLIDQIRDAGGPIDAIGVQGHMDRFITKEQILRRFDILAQPMAPTANHPAGLPGLPIEVTELDINTQQWTNATPAQQAEVTANVLDAAWEHPAVQGVTMWVMNDGAHWRDNAILFDDSDPANWVVKPSGQAWIDRVKGSWWTNTAGFTDADGVFQTQVIKGSHRIVVEYDGVPQEFGIDLRTDEQLTVTLSADPVDTSSSRLVNLSVRAPLDAGQTLIIGFVVAGDARPVLLRAGGPGLTAVTEGAVAGMPNPRLSLFDAIKVQIGENDDWPEPLREVFSAAGAYAFPDGSRDAALLEPLSGAHTAHVMGDAAGTVLVEAYDRGSGTGGRLVNVAARNWVGAGDDILIAGFVVTGSGHKRVLIRGIGPGLQQYQVSNYLANPKIDLHRLVPGGGSLLVATNDDWDRRLEPRFGPAGAFSLEVGSKDAGLEWLLEAGYNYTVSVSGADGGTGEGLIEVYELP